MKGVVSALALALAVGMMGCQKTNVAERDRNDMDQSMNQTASSAKSDADRGHSDLGNRMEHMQQRGENLSDRQFVSDAAAGGTYEVQAAQLALRKSGDDSVKRMAQHLIDDHTKANNQLMAIARKSDINVTPQMTADQQNMISKLNSLQGADFDREYLRQQDAAHRATIQKFEAEAQNGRDPELKKFAAETLPTLQSHLQMVTGQGDRSHLGTDR